MNSHIVVVEDDVDQLANYSYALTKKGFKVSGYESTDEVQHALSGQPSLVLLDIHQRKQLSIFGGPFRFFVP